MNAARVSPLREPSPTLTVDIGCRWSPEHMVIEDRATGMFAERNPEMTPGALRMQSALLCKKRAPWWKRAFSSPPPILTRKA